MPALPLPEDARDYSW